MYIYIYIIYHISICCLLSSSAVVLHSGVEKLSLDSIGDGLSFATRSTFGSTTLGDAARGGEKNGIWDWELAESHAGVVTVEALVKLENCETVSLNWNLRNLYISYFFVVNQNLEVLFAGTYFRLVMLPSLLNLGGCKTFAWKKFKLPAPVWIMIGWLVIYRCWFHPSSDRLKDRSTNHQSSIHCVMFQTLEATPYGSWICWICDFFRFFVR